MTNTTPDITKRKRPSSAGTPLLVRLQPTQLSALDGWIADQPEPATRPEAIRRLLAKVFDDEKV